MVNIRLPKPKILKMCFIFRWRNYTTDHHKSDFYSLTYLETLKIPLLNWTEISCGGCQTKRSSSSCLVWCHFGIIQVCNSLPLRSYLLLNQLVADLSWTLHAAKQPWLSPLIYILYYPLTVSQSEDYQHCEHVSNLVICYNSFDLSQSYKIHQLFLFGKSIFFWSS